MRVYVKSEQGPNLRLPIPLGLLFNRWSAAVMSKCLSSRGVAITHAQLTAFGAELKHIRRRHRGLVLVEVQCQSGEYIRITL